MKAASSSISRRLFLSAAALFICASPTSALAAVRITDVMYDPPGADVGHEWVQITNEGSTSADLAGYRLFEGGINHKLVVAVGTSTLAAQAEAVITTDPIQYVSDHPSFAGTIFKSSFTLSNTGETIELKDAKLNAVDTYSYAAPPKVAAAKTTAIKTSSKLAAPKSKSPYAYANPATAGGNMAASPALALPNLPQVSAVWLYGFVLAALVLLGICGAMYIKFTGVQMPSIETSPSASEFELED